MSKTYESRSAQQIALDPTRNAIHDGHRTGREKFCKYQHPLVGKLGPI